jgi:hypothetical protein
MPRGFAGQEAKVHSPPTVLLLPLSLSLILFLSVPRRRETG